MWSPSYEIIVETLTGSEFEVTVSDRDTVGYIKSKIQKYEGIPVSQQHLLYQHRELADATEMRDVPLVNGSRLKLVLGMKGGPISSKRVVTISDYENWFDMSDVLSRQDAANFKTPGLKLLVNKKNIHRLMKVRAEKASDNIKGSVSRTIGSQSCADLDAEEFERETQKERDDKITAEKLNQIKTKLNMKKKKLASGALSEEVVVKEERSPIARPTFSAGPIGSTVPHYQRPHTSTTQLAGASIATATREPFLPHINFQSAITTSTNPNVAIAPTSANTRRAELDRHSQIRENLQRNRSFKTISAKNLNHHHHLSGNDITVRDPSRLERSLSYHSNGIFNRMDSDPTTGGRSHHATAASYNSTQSQHQLSSASLHDIIELLKYNPSKLRTISHDALNKMVSSKKHHGGGGGGSHTSSAKLVDNASLKNIDEFIRDYDVTMTNRLKTMAGGDCSANLLAESMFNKEAASAAAGFASAEIAFDKGSTGSGLDKTFRTLYKSTSDDNSTYELPKLLIREDSPVESFHSSYPQLETVALRGESPKNFNSMAKLQAEAGAAAAEGQSSLAPGPAEKSKLTSGSLLQLYEHPPPATTAAIGGGASGSGGGSGGTWAPHYGGVGHHHHSDLGINELELKFINNGLMEKSGSGATASGGSVFKLPAVSNLEINHWNALSNDSVNNYARSGDGKDKEEEQASNPRTSNGFIHSDLSISSDEDDLFSISDLIYKSQANKSKSIDLNEFRKTFGSSPTLLNNFGGTNCNLAPQLSRLDAIPSQYRRGYTNLNDAGLSCSTSELECVNATTKKKTGGSDNGELSPLLKHRNNDHVAYVRSYENLNRYKAFSMKNGESSDILRCQQGGGQLLPGISNLDSIVDSDLNSSSGSGSNLIDDSFTDFEYRFSRLSCSGGGCSSTNTSSNTQTSSSSSSNQTNGATGATHRLLPLTDPNHRTRLMYGHPPAFNNTSSPFSNNNHTHNNHHHHHHHHPTNSNNNNNSASAANYYFPSDESLFNIDSFFDDFVEIDTSDIFDNTEYINIGDSRSSNASSSKLRSQKSSSANKQSLLLPEILQQDELLLKTHPGGSFSESASEELLGDEGASASAIRQIDAGVDPSTHDRDSIERELPSKKPPSVHHHPAEPVKSKKLRCAQCNRKLGVIMIMRCHCEKIFCAQHRYAEAHNCSYDFKLEGKKLLERENPLVVAQKLPKI
ncbi:uncharacterized protein LOC6035027 [Culex quinquefasciatus]|uniref:uncharacterized protein LOC6035027 n=1 Tax=Culex quinquefasciatus TaxID=7176 RepID=UPI0018E3DC45|nr:uncharacterized protein LOC6035027 [Culex quinquefasciatus]